MVPGSPHQTLLHHNALTHRALIRLLERVEAHAAQRDLPPELLRRGVAAAVTALRVHHTGEDDVLVPLLRSRSSHTTHPRSAPFEGGEGRLEASVDSGARVSSGTTEALAALHADHDRVAASIARMERAPEADLEAAVSAVLRAFSDHCTREEELFAALPWGAFGEAELRTAGKALSDHSRGNLKPAYLHLPLLLFNLDPEERRAFTDRMPSFVGRLLVPWGFRPGWRAMRPFLTHAPRPVLPRKGAGGSGIR